MEKTAENSLADLMQKRQVCLADGRYLIFYDFAAPLDEIESAGKAKAEPQPQAEATEEKNV
jgi:hypothetical protein